LKKYYDTEDRAQTNHLPTLFQMFLKNNISKYKK